ncbi:hypothetical protein [Bythopirellula goksoeyrii]|uniref:Uncharacterized protein n=1 Tax=Bythopirellula goksoeyrii TaxID=1400387 RepID=A0A5B9QDI9_9BACT|nr:hypothetical protein [Bythopirellula goksoeyrii]QEG35006.1 hypothetical protein Pr1d_22960 [Bythopirellula goksoeyrii]
MKLRPRIKLLTLLLIMTIVALGTALWQNSREVIPLRDTVRELKKELGQFYVDDPSLLHVQRRKTITGSCWRWELCLPTSSSYQLYVSEGSFGEILPGDLNDWLENNHPQRRILGKLEPGHFSFELSVEDYGGKWWIRYATKNEIRGTMQLRPGEDWYQELPKNIQSSDAGFERVTHMNADEPVLLLCVRHGIEQQVDNTSVINQTAENAETLVIWIGP